MKREFFQDDTISGKVYDSRLVKRLFPFAEPYSKLIIAALVLVLGGMGLFLCNPYILGKVVDLGIKPGNRETIGLLAGIFLILEILIFFTGTLQNYLLRYIGQKIMFDIRAELFSHIQRMPVVFFDRNPVGRLVTRTTNDVAALAELFSSGLVVVIGDIFLVVGIAITLVALEPSLGLATLSTVPLLVVAAWYFQTRLRDAYRQVRGCIAKVNSAISENLSGVRIVQIFNREAVQAEKFDLLNSAHREAQLSSVFNHAMLAPVVTVVNAIAVVVILLLGGNMVVNGTISIGLLISFLAYTQHFFSPIRDITEKVSFFQTAMASAERVVGLLDQPEDVPVDLGDRLIDLRGEIVFESVGFAYQPEKPVLKNLSFSIKPGESVAIVGQTGAGKTTIASLLNRFYEIDQGRILLDGRDIKTLSKSFLRKNIVVIQQDVFLFSGNILENIRLWNEEISRSQVEKAVVEAHAEEFIRKVPGNLEGEILERGGNLSSGQRQLIAFARAMCAQPRILILDEATSSVDTETERVIQIAIEKLTQGRTSLIIAHRLSTIQKCDRILVFHHGTLAEDGTHEDLLSRRGVYFRLHELQFKEN